jgi:branched-chain amino acid transport system ATP-binding protein
VDSDLGLGSSDGAMVSGAQACSPGESTGGATALLVLGGVTVTFGGIRALSEIDLHIRRGEIVGIIGPNGAGKTTLFDVISGIRAPTSGTVVFDGADLTKRSAANRARRGLRRTFQRVQVFGWLSVEDNLLTALEVEGGGGGFVGDLVGWPFRRRRERLRRGRAGATLERCGLLEVRDELAGSLPIGVARMVELGRAIVATPRLLLLDEPASGLDKQEVARLGREIQALRNQTQCSIVLVEHDAAFVMEHCDRVVVLDRGRVLAEGEPQEVQRNADVRNAYLGVAAPGHPEVAT